MLANTMASILVFVLDKVMHLTESGRLENNMEYEATRRRNKFRNQSLWRYPGILRINRWYAIQLIKN